MRTVPYALSAVLLLATACGGGGKQGAAPAAAIQAPIQAPIANAGPDQAVSSGATVAQDGSASTDFAGLPLSYAWTAPAGINLSATSIARPTFAAPTLAPGVPPVALSFTLVVSNGQVSSSPANVTITVNAPPVPNPAPIANAGPNQAVAPGATVTLDGSQSSDPDGQALSYAWTAPSGAVLTLVGATTAHPTFAAPPVASGRAALTLPFTLVVSDASASSIPATVTVTVNPPAGATNPPPPGTPTPAPPDPNPQPVGGSGSKRWQIGAVGGGLYLADPAAGEASVQGLVIVTLDKGVPPADTVVTINGVTLVHAPPSDDRYYKVDPSGPRPPVSPGGRMVLAASSASAGVARQLVLPCAPDVAVSTAPAMGSSLLGAGSLQLTFAVDLTLNPAGLAPLAGVSPVATLDGYDPATRVLTAGSPHAIGTGQLGVSLPVGSTPAAEWLVDLRWPGVFIADGGDSGAFCGLVKRWVHSK